MPKDRFVRWGLRQSKLKRRLRNPYFQRNAAVAARGRFHGWKSLLRWFGIAVAAVALIAIPIEACTNEYFALKDTTYDYPDLFPDRQEAVRAAVETELAKPLLWYVDRRNYFLMPTGAIRRAIGETGSYAVISAKRVFPGGLKIAVSAPERVFMIVEGGKDAALSDGEGRVTDDLDTTTSTPYIPQSVTTSTLIDVTISHDASSTLDMTPGRNLIPSNCATLIVGVDSESRRIGLSPDLYTIASDGTEVTVDMHDGWKLLVDPIMTPEDQLERLAAVLRDPRYRDRSKIDYIDVRYPERVYVKPK